MPDAELFPATPDPTVTRVCSQCGRAKPLLTDFKRRREGSGFRRDCRECQNKRIHEWIKAQSPEYKRQRTNWQLYRLTPEAYQALLNRQAGVCAVCRKPFSDNPRLIHVDHKHGCDHADKGRACCPACVRGILCNRCNNFAGWIETDYRRLGDLFHYLGIDGALIWCAVMRDVGYELVQLGEVQRAKAGAIDA